MKGLEFLFVIQNLHKNKFLSARPTFEEIKLFLCCVVGVHVSLLGGDMQTEVLMNMCCHPHYNQELWYRHYPHVICG